MLMQAAGGSDAAEIIEDFNRLNYTTLELPHSPPSNIFYSIFLTKKSFFPLKYSVTRPRSKNLRYVWHGNANYEIGCLRGSFLIHLHHNLFWYLQLHLTILVLVRKC